MAIGNSLTGMIERAVVRNSRGSCDNSLTDMAV